MAFEIGNLPDFLAVDHLLSRLRDAMGAELIQPIGNLRIAVISLDEILSTTGQEVDLTEVEFRNDGTIVFQGRRVILYIRDFTYYNEGTALPKYHVANCVTLQKMKERKRFERYVVATRQDGKFRMRISSDKQTWEEQERGLDICKNCLSAIDWDQYNSAASGRKAQIFSDFHIELFFTRFPNSPITHTPTHTDISAPNNQQYTKDWEDVSLGYRNVVGWQCQECNCNLRPLNLRRFLHVHHKNFNTSDNNPNNLIALCIECHAKQDGHGRLSHTPDWLEFRRLKNG